MRHSILLLACLVAPSFLAAQETVRIYRDAIGLPHVVADSDEAVAYGLGRVHFRDRPVRSLANLTRAAGAMLETLGQLDPTARLTDDLHYLEDRRALRYQRADHARWLLRHYQRPGAPAEDRKLRGLLRAFVQGLNDERKARPKDLASYFVRHLQDLPEEFRFTAAQFEALFARPVEDWEPLALLEMIMRSLWEDVLDRHGVAGNPPRVSRLLPGGSNSWVVPSGGSASGHTYVYADSHQPAAWYVAARFRARRGGLDGGGWTVSGVPFPLAGFGRNVSWSVTLAPSDPIDLYTYDGNLNTSPGTYRNDQGQTTPLVLRTWRLKHRLQPGAPLTTITVTDRYLDRAETIPVTAVHPGRDGHPHLLYAGRFSYEGPRPPTAKDPGTDPFRLLYRMLTARDADDALDRAISQTLSFTGLNVTVGDAVRAITVPADRIPHRRHEKPFEAGWQGYRQVQQMSGQNDGWTRQDGRLYHPVGDFPVVRSDGKTAVRQGKPLPFWANCNNTAIWLLGLELRFGQPESGLPFNSGHTDYANPFDPAAYLRMPIGVTAVSHFGPPWGNHTIRQEWITTGLKVAWDAEKPNGISEATLLAMMTDEHDPLPVYLEARGFFSDLVARVPAGPLQDFAAALRTWAKDRLAPCTLTPPQDARDAARFKVFWALFRHEMQGPWTRAWKQPFAWEFTMPREEKQVMDGALRALTLAVGVFTRYPDLDLGILKRFAIPFGGPDVPIGSAPSAGHTIVDRWIRPPWEPAKPRLAGDGGGRLPLLMRMRKPNEAHHKIQLMTPAAPGRVNTLPEWTARHGPGFHAAPLRWARGEVYELPMTESALKALGYDPQVTLTFTYPP